ncbi:hypothetical protein [Amycolatopsis kentuckyensis]|uniref:hypothetical protein n=1 Tax=Amycolatopsis kentuckyensis TaxID=218823 RepID=UPI000A3BC263|nr:hypothetical protein [Amycolatopsis kentuckyensis]
MDANAAASTIGSVVGFVLCGGLITAGLTVSIIRFSRSRRPREAQLNRVASMLNGCRVAYLSKIETSLSPQELAALAWSRGYLMADHRFTKYYEFVYAPNPGPWRGRP